MITPDVKRHMCIPIKKIPLKNRIMRELKANAFSYIIVSAAFLHFAMFKIIPFVSAFVLSFLKYRLIGKSEFVGIANWVEMFRDELMWKSLWNTVLFTLYYVFPTMVLGLVLALLINSKVKGSKIFRVVYFLPVVTSFVVIAGIWKWMFISQDSGVINSMLAFFHVPTQKFLDDPVLVLPVLAALSVFKVSGTVMIYYFGGLKQIPESMYEAAAIDGATGLRSFFSITLPMLRPTTLYVAITTTIGSFQIFDSAYLLTNGGPNYSSNTIVYYIYQKAFVNMDFGYASALSIVLFIIIFVISVAQKKMIGDDVAYY